MSAFVYALPGQTTLQQEAAIARGLRSLFPDIEFDRRDGAFMTGDIIPIVGHTEPDAPDEVAMHPMSRQLVMEVKTAFAGLLIDALAGPRVCDGCG